MQGAQFIYEWVDCFFLANSADAIIDAGANEVILFLHATCFDSGFNGVAFVFGDTKADGWIFMFVTHVESSCS